jgi:hypothetical protein
MFIRAYRYTFRLPPFAKGEEPALSAAEGMEHPLVRIGPERSKAWTTRREGSGTLCLDWPREINACATRPSHIMEHMDRTQAIAKAQAFAQTSYTSELERICSETQEKVVAMRRHLAAKGMLTSGQQVSEQARIYKEQIQLLAEVRLRGLLDGYEYCDIEIDDQMKDAIVHDVMSIAHAQVAFAQGAPLAWGGNCHLGCR